MTGEPIHSASKGNNGAVCSSYISCCLKVYHPFITLLCQLFSAITQQYEFKELCTKHLFNQVATMKSTDKFHYAKKAITFLLQLVTRKLLIKFKIL